MPLLRGRLDCTDGRNELGARPFWNRALKKLGVFLIILAFAAYLWEHRKELQHALDLSPWHLVGLALLIFVTWFLSGLQTFVMYRAANLPVSIREGIMLTLAGTFGNYLPMRPGTIIRAVYLKEVHGLRFARFGGIFLLRVLLTIMAAGVMGLVGVGVVWLEDTSRTMLQLTLVFLLLAVAPLILMNLPVRNWSLLPPRLKRIAGDFTAAYDELRRQPIVALHVVLLLLAQYFVLGVRFIVSANALGLEISIGFLLLMAPLAAVVSFAGITPGGLGLREAVMGYVSVNLGFSFDQGVFIGTIDRAILLAMVTVFGGIVFHILWRRMNRKMFLRADPKHTSHWRAGCHP